MNPFNGIHSKINDGRKQRSAAVQFKHNGSITLDPLVPTVFGTHAGIINNLSLNDSLDPGGIFPEYTDFPPTHVKQLQYARIISNAIRFSVINGDEADDGYWEAARVQVPVDNDYDVVNPSGYFGSVTTGESVPLITGAIFQTNADISTYPGFCSGKLHELDKYVFSLNSIEDEHPFLAVNTSNDPNPLYTFNNVRPWPLVDKAWDVIIIKIYGRQGAIAVPANPGDPAHVPPIPPSPATSGLQVKTQLYYELVSNQEIVYRESSALSRLMKHTYYDENWTEFLDSLNHDKAGWIP
jgi:hypothetical protein